MPADAADTADKRRCRRHDGSARDAGHGRARRGIAPGEGNEEKVLPLEKNEKVAFIGGFVKNPRYQGGGSSHVNSFKVTSVWDALTEKENVIYAEGFSSETDVYDEKLAAEAIEAVKQADKAVVFAGLPESFESEGYDRKHMHLPECQNKLIAEIVKAQLNTIVVLHNGAAVEMPWLKDVKGLVEAYLGGQAVGQAEANILYGNVNPSGKLAETFIRDASQCPAHTIGTFGKKDRVEYREGVMVGYRYYDTKKTDVLFPFGHGLSYTAFTYNDLEIIRQQENGRQTVKVSCSVTNTGEHAGKETVQIYVAPEQKKDRPVHELKAFEKVRLDAGETKRICVILEERDFSHYDTDKKMPVPVNGTYEIQVGASSTDICLCGKIDLFFAEG